MITGTQWVEILFSAAFGCGFFFLAWRIFSLYKSDPNPAWIVCRVISLLSVGAGMYWFYQAGWQYWFYSNY